MFSEGCEEMDTEGTELEVTYSQLICNLLFLKKKPETKKIRKFVWPFTRKKEVQLFDKKKKKKAKSDHPFIAYDKEGIC